MAADILHQANAPTINMLKEFLSAECVDSCNGELLVCTKQMLPQNTMLLQRVSLSLLAGRRTTT